MGALLCLSIVLYVERLTPVSYTHLDVYKRQTLGNQNCSGINSWLLTPRSN